MNQFIADTAAMGNWQGALGNVSDDINSFKNSFSGPSDLASSLGTIGSSFHNAHAGAQESRGTALGATQLAASRMSDLLGQASQAYQRGDLAAAGRLKAQADQIEGASAPASAGGGDAGAGGAGQMMGQFSQMAGQMMQSVTQPLQGLSQAFGQIPQQAMQGVQGFVEAATQAAGGGGDAAATAADVGGTGAEDTTKTADLQSGKDSGDGGPADSPDAKDDKKDAEHRKHHGEPDHRTEAGASALGYNDRLGSRASAGVRPEDGFGVPTLPAQAHTINPRRQ